VATGEAPSLAYGAELAALAEAMGTRWTAEPAAERSALAAVAGAEAAERVIGVAATFQMMNRLLDGVGAPVRPQLHGIAAELGFAPDAIPR
jgi:hypothetical protein